VIDLTPFGFTPTESRLYGVLLELGPSTGYAVARAARLARANTYGALDGLVTRGAASRGGRPASYRAADPDALIAQLAATQGEALDRLSAALANVGRPGEPDIRAVSGARALATLILHVVARAERRVQGVVAPELVRQTLPAWRRAAERATLDVHVAGPVPPDAASLGFRSVEPGRPTLLLVDDRQAIVISDGPAGMEGVWSSHPALATLARAVVGS
jgi:sugar-specific transcriptional regulator TrmB